MEIKRLLLKEKTSLIKEYNLYVQLNKKEMKDITLFTWTKLGLIPTIQHPISGHHLTLHMPEKIPLNKGQRFVILHAGCKTGFLPGCELVFRIKFTMVWGEAQNIMTFPT
jgi:hypothetical protein